MASSPQTTKRSTPPTATSRPRRVAIVAGLRTPFVRAGGVFRKLTAVELATQCVTELMARTQIDPSVIDRLIYGQVVSHPSIPNIAREVGMASHLPMSLDAYSVSRACATSTQAIVDGAMAILTGDINVALVGGVDCLSRPPMTYSDPFVDAMMTANAAKDTWGKVRALAAIRPKDLMPIPPALKEPSTGMTMGESAEKMAKDNGITRADQDALALRSHQRAAAAWDKGIFNDEVMHLRVPPAYTHHVAQDNLVRADTSLERLSKLRPVFDRTNGSITAGNASPLTDGASALLLMEESTAEALGLTPLAFVASWGFAAVDPNWQLLAAPAIAIPKALAAAHTTLADIDIVDMHEAFAAQVLSNLKALGDADWQKKHAGQAEAAGTVPLEKLNIYGGSIALGHPFAATGARQALTMAHELKRRGKGRALISQCTAGGLGAALILEA
jgi:acetyl-CoA acyltransferase